MASGTKHGKRIVSEFDMMGNLHGDTMPYYGLAITRSDIVLSKISITLTLGMVD